MKKAVFIVLALLLVIASGGGMYYWQQTKIDDINQQKADVQKQLQAQIDQLRQQQSTPTPVAPLPSLITHKSQKSVAITVYTPKADDTVTSPLTIVGQVPGSWSFEGQFPILLKNSQGTVIGQTNAKLQGDWMTDAYVPFTATLTFKSLSGTGGTLILKKDNPSGLADKDDQVHILVRF